MAARAVYADLAQVRHDPEGFLIDFYMLEPEDPGTGWLVVRVRLGHRMTLRLAEALNQNIATWAGKEAKVRELEEGLLEDLARGTTNVTYGVTAHGRDDGSDDQAAKEAK